MIQIGYSFLLIGEKRNSDNSSDNCDIDLLAKMLVTSDRQKLVTPLRTVAVLRYASLDMQAFFCVTDKHLSTTVNVNAVS